MKTPQVPQWTKNLLMGILMILWISPKDVKADAPAGVSFQVFYDELMPYGDWVKDARYGFVWLPAVYEDFHPYGTNGHWVMTSYGNTWISDYDWGWATFHYGRWYYDENYRSWAWIPDYTWGPAWVDWRTGGGYYGWAPMGPGFSVSVRVNIPAYHWVFVPQNRFVYRNVYSYSVPRGRRVTIYNNTTIINNTVVYNNNKYYAGPPRREIEKVTKRSYPERRLESSKAPGRTVASKNSVTAYRPDLQSGRETSASARPSRVLSSGEARTQPAATPSKVNSRSESVSGRPATSGGSSRSVQSATTPGRSGNSGSRSNSTSKGSTFETKPYTENQTRTSSPSNSRSTDTRSTAPASRTGSNKEPQAAPAQTRTQNATPAQKSTQTRTQPAPSRSQSPSPAVKSAPAQTRKATPAPSRSSTQVKSSSGSRTAPASTSRSSSSSPSRSSSTTRGNN